MKLFLKNSKVLGMELQLIEKQQTYLPAIDLTSSTRRDDLLLDQKTLQNGLWENTLQIWTLEAMSFIKWPFQTTKNNEELFNFYEWPLRLKFKLERLCI
jgi:transcription termination factor Rho